MNLSVLDIYNDDIISYLDKCMNRDLANRLTIELLESEDVDDYRFFREKVQHLKDIGCKISIDDFGSGYSNFIHIVELDPDFIKIDGSIIKDIDINERSMAILKAIKLFADNLNITVIAEYIYSEKIYNKILEAGIEYGQGYYLEEPKPIKIKRTA